MNFANHVDVAARNAPDELAVSDRARMRTFRELADDSDRIADALTRRGVGVDDRVAIAIPNGVAFVATYLGVMKRGAVPLPINTRFTDQQIEYVLQEGDAAAGVALDGPDSGGNASNSDAGFGEHEWLTHHGLLDAGRPEFDVVPRRNDDVAELMYTSGTTGAPKGVLHTHGNLDANARGFVRYMEWSRGDVALTACRCFHVTGLNVTTTPFLRLEAPNHLLSEWDVERFLAAVERRDVTYTFLIPTMVTDLLAFEGLNDYDISTLRLVGVGGSPMPKERITEVESALGCTLLEGYGMTETTPLATFNRPTPDGRKPGSIGRVAAEVVAVRIEDPKTGEPVERDERGELLWRGDTVAPRYTSRRLTYERFVERDGERWLASGDIGRMDDDGFLYVVDRLEDMFTTGCGDIYPREIEAVIYELDPVEKVAIVDSKDDVRGATVTAIVKSAPGTDVGEVEIRRICQSRLESHEVPERIVFVEEFPRTATGKLDRVALRDRFG